MADGTFVQSAIDMKRGTRGRLALQGAPCCPKMGETRVLWPQRGDQGGVGEGLTRAREAQGVRHRGSAVAVVSVRGHSL